MDTLSLWPWWPSLIMWHGQFLGSLSHHLWVFLWSKIWKFLWSWQLLLTQPQNCCMLVPGLNREPLLHSPLNSSLQKRQHHNDAKTMFPWKCPLPVSYHWRGPKMRKCSANWEERSCHLLHKPQKNFLTLMTWCLPSKTPLLPNLLRNIYRNISYHEISQAKAHILQRSIPIRIFWWPWLMKTPKTPCPAQWINNFLLILRWAFLRYMPLTLMPRVRWHNESENMKDASWNSSVDQMLPLPSIGHTVHQSRLNPSFFPQELSITAIRQCYRSPFVHPTCLCVDYLPNRIQIPTIPN